MSSHYSGEEEEGCVVNSQSIEEAAPESEKEEGCAAANFPKSTPAEAVDNPANNDGDDSKPKVSALFHRKIFSSLPSIKHRLFSCFSYFFNCHLSSTSPHNDPTTTITLHRRISNPLMTTTTTQTYNCEDDLLLLFGGDDYDDIIGNAIKEMRCISNPLMLDDDDDDDGPIFFSSPQR